MVVPIPWDLLSDEPALVVLVPFLWLLWQIYVPRVVTHFVPGDASYETWWTKTKTQIQSNIQRVEQRVDSIGEDVSGIREEQRKLKNITVAQAHMMNGYDGGINVEEVEKDLLDDEQRRPSDYLYNNDSDTNTVEGE